jgi:hypothetical protein
MSDGAALREEDDPDRRSTAAHRNKQPRTMYLAARVGFSWCYVLVLVAVPLWSACSPAVFKSELSLAHTVSGWWC